jgi:hypothetical protein
MQVFRYLSASRLFVLSISMMVLSFFLDAHAFAADDDYRLTRLEWRILHDEVVVTYDLEGEENENYVVSVTLLRESDKTFRLNPIFVTGKVGKGKFAGTNNEIRWAYKNENAGKFDGSDYYIEVRVEKPGGFPWLIAAGGAAIAGIAIALAANQKAAPPSSSTDQLPYPPPRP